MTGRELPDVDWMPEAHGDVPAAEALAGTGLVVPSGQAPRLYTCPDCGGHGTQPTHARDCARMSAASAWASAGVVVAREGLALYDAGTLCDGDKTSQAGYLSAMLRFALEEIDKAAGA